MSIFTGQRRREFVLPGTEFDESQAAAYRAADIAGGQAVTLDKSLRGSNRLQRSRNVLKRDERIRQLESEDLWKEGQGPFGLPKTKVAKSAVGKKKKKKAKEEDDKEATAATPAKK